MAVVLNGIRFCCHAKENSYLQAGYMKIKKEECDAAGNS